MTQSENHEFLKLLLAKTKNNALCWEYQPQGNGSYSANAGGFTFSIVHSVGFPTTLCVLDSCYASIYDADDKQSRKIVEEIYQVVVAKYGDNPRSSIADATNALNQLL